MSEQTKIETCDSSWNPFIGCDRVSPGCVHCYIEKAPPLRKRGMKLGDPIIELSEDNWRKPFAWNKKPWVCETCGRASDRHYDHSCTGRKEDACHTSNVEWHRRRVFFSLSDWLNPRVPSEWLARMLDTIRQCPNLDFLLCTKRPELWERRLNEVSKALTDDLEGEFFEADGDEDFFLWLLDWSRGKAPCNIWILATVEDQKQDERIKHLLKIPAVVRGLSCEPLLGPIDFNIGSDANWHFNALTGKQGWLTVQPSLNWVIVGARPCNIEWIRGIKDQCAAAGVPCFVKQAGSYCTTDNANMDDWPDEVKIVGEGQGFAAGRIKFKHPKGGDPKEWPEDLRVRQWPASAAR